MSGTQAQIEKAIGQIHNKQPIPEIDFTQHQLENGYLISTQERVVKEVRSDWDFRPNGIFEYNMPSGTVDLIGTIPRDGHSDRRAILV